jgi:hypothetical protein
MRSINRPLVQRTRGEKKEDKSTSPTSTLSSTITTGGSGGGGGGKKKKLLKVLVLHSFRQNARILQGKTTKLRSVLRDVAELVYAESPLSYQPMGETLDASIQVFGRIPDTPKQKCWWHASADNKEYFGLDITLKYIDHMFKTQGPFDGIFGFSQGGALAGILAAMQPFGNVAFKFVMCISGFASRASAHVPLLQPSMVTMPSYHVVGSKDILVDPDRSRKLHACFKDGILYEHNGGHFVPNLWPNDKFREFMTPFLSIDVDETSSTPVLPTGIAAVLGIPSTPTAGSTSVTMSTTPTSDSKTSDVVDTNKTAKKQQRGKKVDKMEKASTARVTSSNGEPTLLERIIPIVDTEPERISQVIIRELREYSGWKDLSLLAVACATAQAKLIALSNDENKANSAAVATVAANAIDGSDSTSAATATATRASRISWLETLRQEIVMTFAAQLHEDRALLINASRWNESQTATLRRQADREERAKYGALLTATTNTTGTTWAPAPVATVVSTSSSEASAPSTPPPLHNLGTSIPNVVDLGKILQSVSLSISQSELLFLSVSLIRPVGCDGVVNRWM